MIRAAMLILCLFAYAYGYAIQGPAYTHASAGTIQSAHKPQPHTQTIQHPVSLTDTGYNTSEFHAAPALPLPPPGTRSVILLFIQSLIAGLLAVFTPYVYTLHPFTIGYLTRDAKSQSEKIKNLLIYAASLIFIFMIVGVLVSFVVKYTGLQKFTDHWIFNLFFCRFFLILGISFLGGFAIKLPAFLVNAATKKAGANTFKGIFYMAISLPVSSFSSTFPIVGLVLVLSGKAGYIGPAIGMLGFAIGISLPFVFPRVLNFFVRSKSLLNNIKVIMGFIAFMLTLKFLSKADESLGWHLIDRDLFIMIWMGLWAIMGVYMLGLVKLSNDTEPEQNIYGQEYISLTRLFIAITSFVFALYLLPGIWGAPLHGVNGFLPQ